MENEFKFENNFTIIFNNTNYPINKELFCYYSPKLKDEIQNKNIQSLNLSDSSFLESSFASFVDACQNRSYSINTSNFYDIRDLSFKYQVEKIINECHEFQEFCPFTDLLIPHLLYKIRKHGDVQSLIKHISTRFSELYQRKELLTIPQDYIKQIIQTTLKFKTDQSIIFKFLTTKYKQNEEVLPLFQILDPNKLTIHELKWILDHPEINTDFISSCYDINQKIKTINDQIKERQEKIDNYAQSIQGLENNHQYHHFTKNIQKLKDKYITKNETDEEQSEKNNDSDIKQEIEKRIDALFGKDSGIYELEKILQDNDKEIPYITENMADDLDFNLRQILQTFEEMQ